jgi:hypothetical protein
MIVLTLCVMLAVLYATLRDACMLAVCATDTRCYQSTAVQAFTHL